VFDIKHFDHDAAPLPLRTAGLLSFSLSSSCGLATHAKWPPGHDVVRSLNTVVGQNRVAHQGTQQQLLMPSAAGDTATIVVGRRGDDVGILYGKNDHLVRGQR